VSAGDLSGDQHGAALVAELRQRRPELRILAFGGAALAEAGAELLYPLADNPIMGFRRVFASLGHFVALLSEADRVLERLRPDAVVLIDFPGFNVNLARLARRHGLLTCYYVCPQYWGWAPWRVRRFARSVDQALVILPFEEEFWRRHGVRATYVGHPVADRVLTPARRAGVPRDAVGILPGSREQEVRAHVPWMLHAVRELADRLGTLPPLCSTHPRAAVRAILAEEAGRALLD